MRQCTLYAHCLRDHPGGIALLAINNSRTASSTLRVVASSERYILMADTLQAKSAKLNGKILELAANDELPSLVAVWQPPDPIRLAPASITFLTVPAAANARCVAD